METLKSLVIILICLAIGVGAIAWQVAEYRQKSDWTIVWIGIIPLPVGVFGILFAIAGIGMSVQLYKSIYP